MKRIDNIIFIILIFGILICVLFWSQLSRYKPPQIQLQEKIIRKKTMDMPEPLPSQTLISLPTDRDIFKLPQWKVEVIDEAVDTNTLSEPYLSTICWSENFSLTIINGEILAERDKDSKSQFRVETIVPDKVGIRFIDDGEFLWLTVESEGRS